MEADISPRLLATMRSYEKTRKLLPQSRQRERGSAETLISDFWPPQLGENTFLFYAECGNLLRQP